MHDYSHICTLNDVDLHEKTVFLRVDFNVPFNIKTGKILDNNRIITSLDTIKYILNRMGKLVILSHLGRVKTAEDLKTHSLRNVASELQSLLNKSAKINFIPFTTGPEVEKAIKTQKVNEIIVLENTRFEDLHGNAESGNNGKLARYWANLCDVFVNDAFGTVHRIHASNFGIAQYSKSSCIGLLMHSEIYNLKQATIHPSHPIVCIVGGAKISDKINVILNLLNFTDYLILGGGMVFTFLKALGHEIGNSLFEQSQITFAKKILRKYRKKIILPIDFAISPSFSNTKRTETKKCDIPKGYMGLDIGPKSIAKFDKYIKDARTLIINGPLGVCEFSHYQKGTLEILKIVSKLINVYSVVGGGDSVSAINKLGFSHAFSHVSTGGGALLEYLEGCKLPSLWILDSKNLK